MSGLQGTEDQAEGTVSSKGWCGVSLLGTWNWGWGPCQPLLGTSPRGSCDTTLTLVINDSGIPPALWES